MANEIKKSSLYIVATPIGNLSDLSERALKTLREVDFVAAEDTRVSGLLLNHFGIKKPIVNYFEHNKRAAGEKILSELSAGKNEARFISRYGCKEYFAHNKELLFYERQKEIITELEKLELED